ncbi:hypothetical protein SORBI_3010G222732 [Sorghum bicolor]|uniref:Uncharacterized protein n=1 Tax=Sorghum bicolor TaxID=4558 RepID=A0A1W0VUB0_SORBI|nr:hypothetical protein SORBI_3010G222732 [Sorghum bicolor]
MRQFVYLTPVYPKVMSSLMALFMELDADFRAVNSLSLKQIFLPIRWADDCIKASFTLCNLPGVPSFLARTYTSTSLYMKWWSPLFAIAMNGFALHIISPPKLYTCFTRCRQPTLSTQTLHPSGRMPTNCFRVFLFHSVGAMRE